MKVNFNRLTSIVVLVLVATRVIPSESSMQSLVLQSHRKYKIIVSSSRRLVRSLPVLVILLAAFYVQISPPEPVHALTTSVPPTCPSGFTLSGSKCVAPATCPGGSSFNGQMCTTTPTCPSGTTLSGGKCVAPQICPAGTTFENKNGGYCVAPIVCPPGTSLLVNQNGSVCFVSATCPAGTTILYVGNSATCAISSPPCSGGENFINGFCTVNPPCPVGEPSGFYDTAVGFGCANYNISLECSPGAIGTDNLGNCIYPSSGCPAGTIFDTSTGNCDVSPTCPTGTNIDTNAGTCTANPTCPTGTNIDTNAGSCTTTPTCSVGTTLSGSTCVSTTCTDFTGNVVSLTPIDQLVNQYPDPTLGLTQQFLATNGGVVDTNDLDKTLLGAAFNFENLVGQQGGTAHITSGFRPTAYQAHLYELKQLHTKLLGLIGNPACSQLLSQVDSEITTRGLSDGVCPPGSSAHEEGLAVDISITQLSSNIIDQLASQAGLYRPYGAKDPVHFQLTSTPKGCIASTVTVHSPVNILIQDPLGRKVGFDPVTNSIINQIPYTVYSGPGTEPQEITFGKIISGTYQITGVGTGNGQYTIEADTSADEPGPLLGSQVNTGTATLGKSIIPLELTIEDTGDVNFATPPGTIIQNSMTVALCSVSTDTGTLSFGSVTPETPTASTPSSITLTNTGNQAATFSVWGTNWMSGSTDILQAGDTQVQPTTGSGATFVSIPVSPPTGTPLQLATGVAAAGTSVKSFQVDITDANSPINPIPSTSLTQTMTFAVNCP